MENGEVLLCNALRCCLVRTCSLRVAGVSWSAVCCWVRMCCVAFVVAQRKKHHEKQHQQKYSDYTKRTPLRPTPIWRHHHQPPKIQRNTNHRPRTKNNTNENIATIQNGHHQDRRGCYFLWSLGVWFRSWCECSGVCCSFLFPWGRFGVGVVACDRGCLVSLEYVIVVCWCALGWRW